MTVEQAIERIEDHMRAHKIGEYPHIFLADALDMALDALRSQRRAMGSAATYVKLSPIDQHYAGLKRKYIVLKSDTGEAVESCFVLRPDRDPAAVAALRAYAEATENKTLADDIICWVGANDPE